MSRSISDLLEMSRVPSDFLIRAPVGAKFDTIRGMGNEKSNREHVEAHGGDCVSEAEIDYNLMGSFPASDPPSWTLGVRPNKTCVEDFEGERPSAHDPSHQNEPLDPED